MMRPLLVAVLLSTQSCAAESLPEFVCARPEVLQLVGERIHHAGQPVILDPATVGQRPGLRPNTVQCAILMQIAVYDTPRDGAFPEYRTSTYQYTLDLHQNGIFLSPVSPTQQ